MHPVLPGRLFTDFSPEGSLYVILKALHKFKVTNYLDTQPKLNATLAIDQFR